MKNLFITAMVALALTSCTSTNTDPLDEGGEGAGPGISTPTFATFHFKTGTTARATEPDAGASAADEKVVKEYRLLIFNATSKVCEANEEITGNGSKTVLLTPGQKKIYVFANTASNATMNPQLEAYAVKGNKTLDEFLLEKFSAATTLGHIEIKHASSAQPAVAGDYALTALYNKTAGEGFPMSSTDKLTYTLQPNITSSDAENANAGDAAKNNFVIDLEYMLAKAGLYKGTAFATTGATVSNLTYTVRNLAKETYLTQQFAGSKVKSVNYLDFAGAATQADFNAVVDYVSLPTMSIADNEAALATPGSNIYIAENTNAALRAGQASYIALTGTYLPRNVVTGASHDGASLTLTTEDWASKTGVDATYLMTLEEFNGANGAIPTGTYFKDAATLQLAANKAEWGIANTGPQQTAPKVATYTEGKSWYRINLGTTTAGNKTEYGVERGKQYQVALNKITGPGLPSDECLVTGDRGDGTITNNPSDPVDAQTYVSVSIRVKGWTTAGQSADL